MNKWLWYVVWTLFVTLISVRSDHLFPNLLFYSIFSYAFVILVMVYFNKLTYAYISLTLRAGILFVYASWVSWHLVGVNYSLNKQENICSQLKKLIPFQQSIKGFCLTKNANFQCSMHRVRSLFHKPSRNFKS